MKEVGCGKLEKLIREEANNVNPIKDLAFVNHRNVCKELVSFCDVNHYPMTLLVYIGVGTNAHRPIVFQKGYKFFDIERTNMVLKLCDIFAKKFGNKWRTNDLLAHMICRYIDSTKHRKELKFRQMVNACIVEKINGIKIDTAKKLAKILFDTEATYSKSGYIVNVKDCD